MDYERMPLPTFRHKKTGCIYSGQIMPHEEIRGKFILVYYIIHLKIWDNSDLDNFEPT